jgi:phosphoglycerate dehydrogenase-like enzyme
MNRAADNSTLRVFWYQPRPQPLPEQLTMLPPHGPLLAGLLAPGIQIVAGSEVPHGFDFHVLIGVSPPPSIMGASASLHTFVIPQAGFTAAARAAVEARPGLAVHNLHNNAIACAETAVSLMLACAKRTCEADADLRQGRWTTRYSSVPQRVLAGTTAVVLGYGSIGRAISPVCRAMGMDVIGVRRSDSDEGADAEVDVVPTSRLHEVLPRADVLLMALPATMETDGIIGQKELSMLPNGAIVVNVGRAGQIDERALFAELQSQRLGGAGLDVWPTEPTIEQPDTVTPPSALPFHELDNVVMSPHKAGWLALDDGSKAEALAEILNAIRARKTVPNRVDVDVGY